MNTKWLIKKARIALDNIKPIYRCRQPSNELIRIYYSQDAALRMMKQAGIENPIAWPLNKH